MSRNGAEKTAGARRNRPATTAVLEKRSSAASGRERPRPSVSDGLPKHVVEVTAKYGMIDAEGAGVLSQIQTLGIPGVKEVRVSSLYQLTGKLSPNQIQQASRELLADPITQEYRIAKGTPSRAFLMGPHWRLEVWPKPSVSDPASESVRKAVRDLGLPEPAQVRTGKAYHVFGRIARTHIERVLDKLLSNPVIHRTKLVQR